MDALCCSYPRFCKEQNWESCYAASVCPIAVLTLLLPLSRVRALSLSLSLPAWGPYIPTGHSDNTITTGTVLAFFTTSYHEQIQSS